MERLWAVLLAMRKKSWRLNSLWKTKENTWWAVLATRQLEYGLPWIRSVSPRSSLKALARRNSIRAPFWHLRYIQPKKLSYLETKPEKFMQPSTWQEKFTVSLASIQIQLRRSQFRLHSLLQFLLESIPPFWFMTSRITRCVKSSRSAILAASPNFSSRDSTKTFSGLRRPSATLTW